MSRETAAGIDRLPIVGGEYTVARWGDRVNGAIVALHGITASHKAWSPLVDRLATPRMVLAPDLRGRGGSAGLPGPFGLAAHVRDLLATLDHNRVDRGAMVGHSLGAYLALEFALTAPEAVRVDGMAPLSPEMLTLIDRITKPMVLLTVPRGLLNQPEPLLPKALVDATRARLPGLECREIANTNHYAIVIGSGTPAVAAEIDRFVERF